MSSVGTTKKEGILTFFKMLFKTEEIDINDQAESVDQIQPNDEISADVIKELQDSEKRIESLTEKYKIEKFETTPKVNKKAKQPVSKEPEKTKKQKQPKIEEKELDGEERE